VVGVKKARALYEGTLEVVKLGVSLKCCWRGLVVKTCFLGVVSHYNFEKARALFYRFVPLWANQKIPNVRGLLM